MYIVAVFAGEQGSMGLERDKRYVLKIREYSAIGSNIVEVVDTYPRIKIPYNSLHSFFRNWIVTGTYGDILPSNHRQSHR